MTDVVENTYSEKKHNVTHPSRLRSACLRALHRQICMDEQFNRSSETQGVQNRKRLHEYVVGILIVILLSEVSVVTAQDTGFQERNASSSAPVNVLYDEEVRQRLISFKEIGYWVKAYEEYQRLLPHNRDNPRFMLDFIHLLLIMGRTEEAWDWLHKLDTRSEQYQEQAIKKQLTFVRALGFVLKGEYKKARKEIEPFLDSREDQKLISDIFLLSGFWNKSLIVAKQMATSYYHTPYERELATARIKEIAESWSKRLTGNVGILDSEKHGLMLWDEEQASWPINLETRFMFSHLNIENKHAFSLGVERFYSEVLPRPSYQYQVSITDNGKFGGRLQKVFYPLRNFNFQVTGFYNEPERGEAALMKDVTLKRGGILQTMYGFSDRITSAIRYEFADYPQGHMHVLSTTNVYSQHLIFRRPLVYHTIILLLIDGSGDEDLFPDRLFLSAYVFGISYPLGKRHHDHIDFTTGMGYQFSVGSDEGPYWVPKIKMEWSLLGDLELNAEAEYRRDFISGTGEWRINSGFRFDF